ncbi:MAG: nitroreductase [Euryarchaeota archaeon]|nr:nitroreductase [Euryarchaeota archaeon]
MKSMDVLEMMRKRRPVKRFKRVPIPDEKLNSVLGSMRLAPSASNLQPWKFVVVRDDQLKQRLASACQNQKFIADAPVLIVGCATIAEAYPYLGMYMSSYPLDMGLAMCQGELAAFREGLSSHWVYQFHNEKVQELLSVPQGDVNVVFILALGFPEEEGEPDGRKNLSEIVRYEKYS